MSATLVVLNALGNVVGTYEGVSADAIREFLMTLPAAEPQNKEETHWRLVAADRTFHAILGHEPRPLEMLTRDLGAEERGE